MFFQYYLSQGHTQNLFLDTIKEKIFYLPKELSSIEEVVREYTDYECNDSQPISTETFVNQWVQFFEIELNPDLVDDVFVLANNCLTDYLLFRVSQVQDLEKIAAKISRMRDSGSLALRQVYLIFDFEVNWDRIPEDPSGLIVFLNASDIERSRKITLQNFKVMQQLIIQSQSSNLFYHSRLYIDADGYIKSHAESSSIRFPIKENIANQKALVADEELTRFWNVSKDQITVCKACEYRNICIDAAPLNRLPNGEYQRNTPCPYDPFTGQWKAEEAMIIEENLINE